MEDEEHVEIKALSSRGSEFFKYKNSSIILLAFIDHNYLGGDFKNSLTFQHLENGLIPEDGLIVEDAALPLQRSHI